MTPVTLEACLESLAQMEHEYIVTDQGHRWTTAKLLELLRQHSPGLLALQVYVRLPSSSHTGAIAQLDGRGGFCVIYRIEDRSLTTSTL